MVIYSTHDILTKASNGKVRLIVDRGYFVLLLALLLLVSGILFGGQVMLMVFYQ